jgi:hypothetical protein
MKNQTCGLLNAEIFHRASIQSVERCQNISSQIHELKGQFLEDLTLRRLLKVLVAQCYGGEMDGRSSS